MIRLVAFAVALLSPLLFAQVAASGEPAAAGSRAASSLSPQQEQNVRRLLARPRAVQDRNARGSAAKASNRARTTVLVQGQTVDEPPSQDTVMQAPPARVQRSDETRFEVQQEFPYPLGTGRSYVPWAGGPVYDPYIGLNEYGRYLERRAFNARDMSARRERIYARADRSLEQGLEQLYRGEYPSAAMTFRLAAELDQGDPAARIHLAQALLMTRRYDEAGRHLRRALSLQPKLVFVASDWSPYFGRQADWTQALEVLRSIARDRVGPVAAQDALQPGSMQPVENEGVRVRRAGAGDWSGPSQVAAGEQTGPDRAAQLSADGYFLLGYLEFQAGNTDSAHTAFVRSARLGRADDALREYLRLTH